MSSNDENSSHESSSSDESEDIKLTGLVATRERRQTAGNNYATTLGEYDDPELQALFAEEDEGSDEYESSEQDDDEAAMDSSSSDEDAGPPKEGDAEDLTGEKELKRAERAEQNKKRKAQQAKLTVPAFAKKVKRVQLADEVQADDGSSSAIERPIPKKTKPKRDSQGDGPTRQSSRASAVAFRETVSVNLQESAVRSKKHKTALQETMKRERAARRTDLTIEERLEKCKKLESETAKELGRFEREEAERVRLREEALMAKRRRAVEGPLIRTFSTSALYENGKLKIKRLQHGSQTVESILAEQTPQGDDLVVEDLGILPEHTSTSLPLSTAPTAEQPLSTDEQQLSSHGDHAEPTAETAAAPSENALVSAYQSRNEAEQPPAEQPRQGEITVVKVESVGDQTATDPSSSHDQTVAQDFMSPAVASNKAVERPETVYTLMQQDDTTAAVPEEPAPIVREQAQRHMIILEEFANLEAATGRRSKAASAVEPTAIAQLLMPDSYPTFTDEEAAYLRKTRKLKQELHPKQLCALTSWEGKYQDAKTGIVFADVPAYKMLQRLIAGGCSWNSMLECWSAPFVGMIGRPASGVPDGFAIEPSG